MESGGLPECNMRKIHARLSPTVRLGNDFRGRSNKFVNCYVFHQRETCEACAKRNGTDLKSTYHDHYHELAEPEQVEESLEEVISVLLGI